MRKLNSELLNFWIDNAHNKTVFCISVSVKYKDSSQYFTLFVTQIVYSITFTSIKNSALVWKNYFPRVGAKMPRNMLMPYFYEKIW